MSEGIFIDKVINFNDLTEEENPDQIRIIYYDFLECDPVPFDDVVACPFQPMSPNCTGLDTVIFIGQEGDDLSIDCLEVGKVVAQVDGSVQVNVGKTPYTLSVFNCAVLH